MYVLSLNFVYLHLPFQKEEFLDKYLQFHATLRRLTIHASTLSLNANMLEG